MSHLIVNTDHLANYSISTCFSGFSLASVEASSIQISDASWYSRFTTFTTDVSQPTSTTDVPQPLSTTNSNQSGKGLCYNDPDLTQAFKGTSVGWVYNWAGQ